MNKYAEQCAEDRTMTDAEKIAGANKQEVKQWHAE